MIATTRGTIIDVIGEVLAKHAHLYDSDCIADHGCTCGGYRQFDIDVELDDARALYAGHLQDALVAAIEAAQVADPVVERVRAAWINEGPSPRMHARAKRLLDREWPMLSRAVKALVEATS